MGCEFQKTCFLFLFRYLLKWLDTAVFRGFPFLDGAEGSQLFVSTMGFIEAVGWIWGANPRNDFFIFRGSLQRFLRFARCHGWRVRKRLMWFVRLRALNAFECP